MQIKRRKEFGTLLNHLGLNRFGVEIGVWKGVNVKLLRNRWNHEKLYLVDSWESGRGQRYYNHIKSKYLGKSDIEIIKERSEVAHLNFEDGYFDFIYIDARHDLYSVSTDLLCWYRKLKSGGLFSGHDYLGPIEKNFGVKLAVDNLVATVGADLYITAEGSKSSWYFCKP